METQRFLAIQGRSASGRVREVLDYALSRFWGKRGSESAIARTRAWSVGRELVATFAVQIEFMDDAELRTATRPGHREYLRGLLEAGKLRISGPYADDTGALIVYEAENMAEAEQLLESDPYRAAGVIANATIKEWNVVMKAD